jgi:hypothetical protein
MRGAVASPSGRERILQRGCEPGSAGIAKQAQVLSKDLAESILCRSPDNDLPRRGAEAFRIACGAFLLLAGLMASLIDSRMDSRLDQ